MDCPGFRRRMASRAAPRQLGLPPPLCTYRHGHRRGRVPGGAPALRGARGARGRRAAATGRGAARYSCVNCSGDVVPEKDLVGCWPLWPQFAPDELRYRCERRWTVDPGLDQPAAYRAQPQPLPCWQTCWTPMGAAAAGGAPFCTAACPEADALQPASTWRRAWLAARDAFEREPGDGRDWVRTMAFVEAKDPDQFIWNVY